MNGSSSRRAVAIALLIAALASNALLIFAGLTRQQVSMRLSPAKITHELGYASVVPLKFKIAFPYTVRGDGMNSVRVSSLALLENGRELGPPHSVHAEIREVGGGRYSHWGRNLYFSSSDGSDPRTNGREYVARVTTSVHPVVALAALIFSALAVIAFRKTLYTIWLARAPLILIGGVAALAVLYGLAANEAFEPLSLNLIFSANGEVVTSIIWHILLGAALLVEWISIGGLAWMLISRRRDIPFHSIFLHGYPFSLALTTLITIAVIYWSTLFGILVLVTTVSAFVLLWRPGRDVLARVLSDALLILPFAVSLCVAFGVAWHGALAGLPGALIGDDAIYTGKMHALSFGVWPPPKLGIEGESIHAANLLPSAIAQSWAWIPDFESQLFFATSLTFVSVYFSMLTLVALIDWGQRQRRPQLPAFEVLIAACLVAAGTRYANWSVESPPVVFFIPVVGSLFVLCRSELPAHTRLTLSTILAFLGTAISKVTALPVSLGYVLGIQFEVISASLKRSFGLQVIAVLLASYCVFMLIIYAPFFTKVGIFGPQALIDFLHGPVPLSLVLLHILKDIGIFVVTGTMLFLIGERGLRFAGAIAALLYALSAFLFYMASVTAFWFAAAAVLATTEVGRRGRSGLMLGAALGIPSVALTPGESWPVSLLWPVGVIATLSALAIPRSTELASCTRKVWPVPAGLTVACVLGAAVILLAALADPRVYTTTSNALIYTPELRDIWQATRLRTPKDALIFTDQTGPEADRLSGWNDFALQASRQFYIVTWATSAARTQPDLLRARLRQNDEVLSGSLSPERLPLSRHYSSYFAVVRRDKRVPPNFELIYQNEQFSLYRIDPRGAP